MLGNQLRSSLRRITYIDLAGNNAETSIPGSSGVPVDAPVPLPTGRGSWTFTPPLAEAVHISGLPHVTVDVAPLVPGAHLVSLLYDIDPDGAATFVSRGAYLVPGAGIFTFEMFPQDWRFPAGHRIGLLLTGADDWWFEPPITGLPVTVRSGMLTLPALSDARVNDERPRFRPRALPAPFVVDGATISDRTVVQTLPASTRP
jgi:hypothetical protein